jgi:cysteinyl-tRNA synthetase
MPKILDELRVLGVSVDAMPPAAEAAIEKIISLRDEARRAKNWPESDRLRDALARCGVELKDSKEGTTWAVASTSMI